MAQARDNVEVADHPIKDNTLKLIKVDNPPALPALQVSEGKLSHDYAFIRSVQLKDGSPYAVVNVHLERSIYARDPDAFREHTALPVLATLDGVDIEHAHQTLIIGSADPVTANLLHVPLGAPTAECHCVVTDSKGLAIYVAEIVYRNDCVKLYISLIDRTKSGNGAQPASPVRTTIDATARRTDEATRWACGALRLHIPSLLNGQSYPGKIVRIVNPFAPGGNTDFVTRALIDKVSPILKQQTIVENRPGATKTSPPNT